MANILAEVLNVNYNAQQSHFRDQLNKVTGRIAGLKTELIEATETVFVLADADIDRVTSWSVELSGTQKQLQILSEQFEKDKKALETSSEEMDTTAEELDDCSKNIDILQKLVEVVRNVEIAVPDNDVHQAGKALSRAGDILQELKYNFPAVEDKMWYKCLHLYVQEKMASAQNHAVKKWNTVFRFETGGLVINPDACDIPELVDTIENTQVFKKVWTKFCDQIWQELLSRICSLDYTVQININARNNVMQRTFSNKTTLDKTKYYDCDYLPTKDTSDVNLSLTEENGNAGDIRAVPVGCCSIKCRKLDTPIRHAKDVFRYITDIISSLKDAFNDKWEIMDKMGETLSSRLCDALSTKCLKILILKNSNGDITKARQDLEAMRNFVGDLSATLYFNVDAGVFDGINLNFETAFIEQLREDLIVRIRNLVKSDTILHTVEVGLKESTDQPGAVDEIAAFHRNPMKFPRCVVSMSVVDIVTLLKNHLGSYPDDLSLMDGAYNMYLSLVTVPKSESEAGDLVPLSAVLIHNNAMFLSHHASVTFPMSEDKIPLLRSKASQAFSFMMKSIRTKLNGMISEAMRGLDERVKTSVDEVHTKFQVIASEFLRLDNLFKGILPPRVWKKTLATLVDHTVNEMCSKVLSWDDVSATTAQELAESFTRFSVSVSELFKGDATSVREIDVATSKIVNQWQRFRLLTFVVTASMKEIEDKWVDGCGPLAVAFSGEEVRRLVRALFQNTDHRAAFLASIK